ncbi:MAG: hypothetical protein HC927_06910 [Deltaproteobacteria bacterium]|nr:hypothetical protein [Deltaproteobacteria bacterium]
MKYDRMVIGYHGCEESVAEEILAGKDLLPSRNTYDWLGHGTYFWEFGLDRAIEWGNTKAQAKPGERGAVIGAVIQTGNCFDLLDTRYVADLRAAYLDWERDGRGASLVNRGLARHLDCAFFNWYFDQARASGVDYDTSAPYFMRASRSTQPAAYSIGHMFKSPSATRAASWASSAPSPDDPFDQRSTSMSQYNRDQKFARQELLVADEETGLLPMPPLPHAEAHARLRERLRTMTDEEFHASLIRTGILNPDGTLADYYRDDTEVASGPA